MPSYSRKEKEIKSCWELFISALDNLGFTGEQPEYKPDIVFDEQDYIEQEKHLLQLYLKE